MIPSRNKPSRESGFALISVLIALVILMALLLPFMESVFNEQSFSGVVVDVEKNHHQTESLRDLALHLAAKGHRSKDDTPDWDGLAEFAGAVDYPDVFRERQGGRKLQNSTIVDLQRKIHLPTASPLVLANLLGLAASLSDDHEPDTDTLTVSEAENFPEEDGALLVYGERIGYSRREGSVFHGLSRRQPTRKLPDQCLVLDYRVVQAVTYQFEAGSGNRDIYVPYGSVEEVQNIGRVENSTGVFTRREMDILSAHCTTFGTNDFAARWGKPERVFTGQDPDQGIYSVRSKSALGFGGGTVVKITSNEDPSVVEYNMVWATHRPQGALEYVNLQTRWELRMLFPPRNAIPQGEAIIRPLIPIAVNVNTASREVLVALLETIRKGPTKNQDQETELTDKSRLYGNAVSKKMAEEIADELIALRSGATEDGASISERGQGMPFQGFQDLCERFFFPRANAAEQSRDGQTKTLLFTVFLNMLYGRSPAAEMGTMPITFASGSLMGYRVSSMETMLSGLETARKEITGVASVMPGDSLDMVLVRQRGWLENVRLNRRAPGWLTFPISVGPVSGSRMSYDPAEVAQGMLYPTLHPTAGFGNPRFPSEDRGTIRASTSIDLRVISRKASGAQLRLANEQFYFAQDPDGRDIAKDGPFDMINTGPRARGGQRNSPRHPDASFNFTTDNEGMPGRHAVSFWFKLENLQDQCLYDFAGDLAERNRINLRIEAGNLVFEVLDETGLDPNPGAAQTSPERTSGLWRVPISELMLKPEIWYHVNISADGNRPDQLSLFFDGTPRGTPQYVTFTTAVIPSYQRPGDDTDSPAERATRYIEIPVDSTDGFPKQGVLRIGRELFEYTSISSGSFLCNPVDSMGGRKARMGWWEFNDVVPSNLDERGRPTIGENDPALGTTRSERTPEIPRGATVELYGYAAALYRNKPVAVGATALTDSLGAFAVARAMFKSMVPIEIPARRGSFRLGEGIDEKSTEDIILVDPLPDESGKGVRKPQAADAIIAAFAPSGGYCLFVQKRAPATSNDAAAPGTVEIGGIEMIRYSGRNGNVLTGIERGVMIPGAEKVLSNIDSRFKNGEARKFVAEWVRTLTQQPPRGGGGGGGGAGGGAAKPVPLAELQAWVLYVVPISVGVGDTSKLNDPAETGLVEWAQIYPGEGNEQDTEWIRYDVLSTDRHMVRARSRRYANLHNVLTGGFGRIDLVNGGGAATGADVQFQQPQDDGIPRIGYIDQVEIDWPIAHAARRALDFRGDRFSRTSSHAQNARAVVTACHRLELDGGPIGAMNARCGRNDRVAMVGGTKAKGESRPPMEWHTINWVAQRHSSDNYTNSGGGNTGGGNTGGGSPERLGLYPFQMVAFKDGVRDIFVGPESRQDQIDTRLVDRVIKFPSGEMPAAYVEAGWFGGVADTVRDYQNATGMVDEVVALGKHAKTTLLAADISEEAMEVPIRKHTEVHPYGVLGVPEDLLQTYPNGGGLIQIDREVIAYASFSDGIFRVANNGRGLLGTEPRPHADCARVQFLAHVPAAILSGGVSVVANEFSVQDIGSLPEFGGTVLNGGELVHYAWTIGRTALVMPKWYDPDDPEGRDASGVGLFRGRYGTPPQSAESGSPLIWFPTRFLDRYHERSDDPELGYFQATRRETSVFFKGVQWREDNPEPSLLKLIAIVNIDGAGSFADDPEKVRGMFLFEDGTVEDLPNPIGMQGSLFEMRFATQYQPGSFDPVTFQANAWKQAITVKDMLVTYEGQSRILAEEETGK